jgi:hypothetical protein
MACTIAGKEVLLVPQYTGKGQAELSYQDARALADLLSVIPEAELQGLRLLPGKEIG